MNESENKKFDLEERLIDFAALIIGITENLYIIQGQEITLPGN